MHVQSLKACEREIGGKFDVDATMGSDEHFTEGVFVMPDGSRRWLPLILPASFNDAKDRYKAAMASEVA